MMNRPRYPRPAGRPGQLSGKCPEGTDAGRKQFESGKLKLLKEVAVTSGELRMFLCQRHEDPVIERFGSIFDFLMNCFKKWRIKINPQKFNHITFTLRSATFPTVLLGCHSSFRYLGFYLVKSFTWNLHFKLKRQVLNRRHILLLQLLDKLLSHLTLKFLSAILY